MSIQELITNLHETQHVITDDCESWHYGDWFLVANAECTRFQPLMFVRELRNDHVIVRIPRQFGVEMDEYMIPAATLNRYYAGRVVAR